MLGKATTSCLQHLRAVHELHSDQFVKTVCQIEKFYSILKKQQVKQTSPLNTALVRARAGTQKNLITRGAVREKGNHFEMTSGGVEVID